MAQPLSLGSTVNLFQVDEVLKAMENAKGQGGEALRRVYTKMLEMGPSRFVSKPTSAEGLVEVGKQCPNFSGVLEDLEGYVELALASKGGFSVLPLLLTGDPGVGKTHFAKCLANALSLPYQFLSMGTMSAGWVLSGSAPTWSGARHGKIAASLIDSDFANPLYLIDELDKTGGDSRYDPYGALLQLMERDTARHFKDEFLDVALDASSVVWVATANDAARIPDYILSRMAVYEVPAPTQDQGRVIAANIFSALCAEHGWAFEAVLSPDTQDAVSRVAPREMKKKLLDGVAHAMRAKRGSLLPEDVRSSHVRESRKMGFLAQ